MREAQEADKLLVVRPFAVGANPETAASNAFQGEIPGATEEELRAAVWAEFDGFVETLRGAGIDVFVVQDTPDPPTPDALFPNNWVSFHAGGTVAFYPMEAPLRRAEVRPELVDELGRTFGRTWGQRVDLTPLAERGEFLEGTGSVVLDRSDRVAYACLSSRTTEAGLAAFAEALGYAIEPFRAVDAAGLSIYHTNVLMSVGATFAVLCGEAIPNDEERAHLRWRLGGEHELIEITLEQMNRFAGNMLAVRGRDGETRIVMSSQAHES